MGVDSYFVKDGNIHAVVRTKNTRYVCTKAPSGKYEGAPILNKNRSLVFSQALPNNILLDLKKVADDISELYRSKSGKKPMDIEYTVALKDDRREKSTIFLLQARPLLATTERDVIEHTYLDLKGLRTIEKKNKIRGDVLLDGNAYVREITNYTSILFADTLPKALDAYLHRKNSVPLQAIVIKKMAPATSHEAVILRPKGVAVVVIQDDVQFESLKKMANQASQEKPLLLDMQRGIAICLDAKSKRSLIKKGRISYPIPLEVTVPSSRLLSVDRHELAKNRGLQHVVHALFIQFNQEADALIASLLQEEKLPIAKEDGHGYELEELVDLMAAGSEAEAKIALGTLLLLMKKRLIMSMKETEEFRAAINQPMFQLFEAAVNLAKKEILPSLSRYPAESLERLYPIKFLDAMIQQKSNENVMACHSYCASLAQNISEKEAIKIAKESGITFHRREGQFLLAFQQMTSYAYNEECQKNWQQFVKDISELPPQEGIKIREALLPIVLSMHKLNMAEIWLNTTFFNAWKRYETDSKEKRVKKVIEKLKQTDVKSNETFSWISRNLSTLQCYEHETALWENRAHIKKNLNRLKTDFTEKLGFDKRGLGLASLKTMYEKAAKIERLALLQYIRRAVNVYDSSIKAVKGSEHFSNIQEQAIVIGDMLQGYLEMMEATFTLIGIKEQKELQGDRILSLPLYVEKLKTTSEYHFGFDDTFITPGFEPLLIDIKSGIVDASTQIEARPEFAVDALVIGSNADADFSVHWPQRLEEYFTTFHQNMEQVVKYLNTKNGLDTSLLSGTAKAICDQAKILFGQDISYMIQEDGVIKVGYQIPVQQHSASFVVTYNPSRPQDGVTLEIKAFGNDENTRWDRCATLGALLAFHYGTGFEKGSPPQINYERCTGVSLSVHIEDGFNEDTKKMLEALRYMIKVLTMDQHGDPAQFLWYMDYGDSDFSDFDFTGVDVDWCAIPSECFKYTLHINEELMTRLADHEVVVAKIAMNSFLGMAFYGLYDYTRVSESLAHAATENLKTLLPFLDAKLIAEITDLIEKPEIENLFPEMCSALSFELGKITPDPNPPKRIKLF